MGNLFFQFSRSCLQLIISASQCCVPVLDVGQHGVETIDETTDLVRVRFDRPNLIVLVGGHHPHCVLQVHDGSGNHFLKFRRDKLCEKVRNQHEYKKDSLTALG